MTTPATAFCSPATRQSPLPNWQANCASPRTNAQNEGNIGIGFAVPSNTVRELLPQLRQGKVIRGRIGVSVSAVPREGFADFGLKSATGAIVSTVSPGGAAAKAGIEPGDVIVEFNSHPVTKYDDLVKTVIESVYESIIHDIAATASRGGE